MMDTATDGGGLDAEALLAVPSQEDIGRMLLQRRKEVLMAKYASEDLLTETEQTKALTGRR